MANLYKITCDDFQSCTDNVEIIVVKNNIVYCSSTKSLKTPFEKIKELPSEIQAEIDEQETIKKQIEEKRIEQENKELEILKEKKKEELEALRLSNCEKSIEYKGKTFQATQKDQTLISNAILLYSGIKDFKMQWICEDNSMIELTGDDLKQLGALLGQRTSEEYIRIRLLKDKVESAKTIEEVEKIEVK